MQANARAGSAAQQQQVQQRSPLSPHTPSGQYAPGFQSPPQANTGMQANARAGSAAQQQYTSQQPQQQQQHVAALAGSGLHGAATPVQQAQGQGRPMQQPVADRTAGPQAPIEAATETGAAEHVHDSQGQGDWMMVVHALADAVFG